MSENLVLKDSRFADVIRDYEDKLSATQIAALPYLAFGATIKKTSEIVGVEPGTVSGWMRNDISFKAALTDAHILVSEWHSDVLNQVAVLAWEHIWEILQTDYDKDDKLGRSEKAKTARFIVDRLNIKPKQVEVKHEVEMPQLNIEQTSIDLIARRLHELDTGDDGIDFVDAKFTISDIGQMACHPDTDYGKVNIDTEIDKRQCHVCGEWFRYLSVHSRNVHGMDAEDYRRVFKISGEIRLDPEPKIDEED